MDKKTLENKVKKLFKENNFNYEWEIDAKLPNVLHVEVIWGDWKHDHIALKNVLAKNKILLALSKTIEEDGSDAYSASYTFIAV